MLHKPSLLSTALIALIASLAGVAWAGAHPTAQVTVRPLNTGQTYVPSLRLFRTPIAGRVQTTTAYRMAIFPLADYSHQQAFISPPPWGGNRRIIETITDHFIAHGIGVAVQDDVEAQLVTQGLLQPLQNAAGDDQVSPGERFAQRASVSNSPEFEMLWGMHSEEMRDELQSIVQTQDYGRPGALTFYNASQPALQGVVTGIPKEKIIELGRLLDVDLIIRGRILEYGINPASADASVVQIRLYAQEAKSGELFWSNRGEFQVSYYQGFGSPRTDAKALFDRASREVVDALLVDFFGER